MAISPFKTFIAGEILTASDLNSSFTQITNNSLSLISPLTGALDMDGHALTMDAAAVTTLQSTLATGMDLSPGPKSGAPGATGSIFNSSAFTFTDTTAAISGTPALFTGLSLGRPTLAATNTGVVTTNAATFYIANAPLAGTNQTITNPYALLIAAGAAKFGGAVKLGNTTIDDSASATTWTPNDQSGDGLGLTGVTASYTRIGNLVFVYGRFIVPAQASATTTLWGGLPFTVANATYAASPGIVTGDGVRGIQAVPVTNSTRFVFLNALNGSTAITNGNLSGVTCAFSFFYPIK